MLYQHQIDEFDENELGLLLYIINVAKPISSINRQYEVGHLKWIDKDVLVKHLLDSFKLVKEDGHSIFTSMMLKLGVKVEINKIEPPKPPEEIKQEITQSVLPTPTGSVENK